MVRAETYRALSQSERDILCRLLEVPFPGREELKEQLVDPDTRTIDEFDSIELRPKRQILAPVKKTVPVEAEAPDADGIMIRYLLFVRDGLAYELQIYKDDGSPIVRRPGVADLRVMVLPE